MQRSKLLESSERIISRARELGLVYRTTEDHAMPDWHVSLDGRRVLNMASCSYLGLHRHPELIAGVHDAVERYGTQFSCSRAYLSATPYLELEDLLGELFGGEALVTPSTTLAHQIALPVLATEDDALVLDSQVHHSVHLGADLARANGARKELVRHDRPQQVLERIETLLQVCDRVWYCTDGVFSMFGDLVSTELLEALLALSDRVHLYIDDAHGMSWAGRHGRGSALSRFRLDPRLVLATSLNKAFSAGGAALVFEDPALRERVRMLGGPMMFGGPLQPPMLGAAVASARLHLSPEIEGHQDALRTRVRYFNQQLGANGVPVLVENDVPIVFIPVGEPELAMSACKAALGEGVFTSIAAFPAVPMRYGGLRTTVTAAHTRAELDHAAAVIARAHAQTLERFDVSLEGLQATFAKVVPSESRTDWAHRSRAQTVAGLLDAQPARVCTPRRPDLQLDVEEHSTITAIAEDAWDRMLGEVGAISWQAMRDMEEVFADAEDPRERCTFRYLLVRHEGAIVGATVLTQALCKDDMLMAAEISEAVEARRREDPLYLTSAVLMTGTLLSEGEHVYLDRSGPWEAALEALRRRIDVIRARDDAHTVMIRDIPADDLDVGSFLAERGFLTARLPDRWNLHIDFEDLEGWMTTLSRRKRRHMRRQAARMADYRVQILPNGPLVPALGDHLHTLYRGVAEGQLRLNVFPLPRRLLDVLARSPAWELGLLHLDAEAGGPEDGRAVAFWAIHRHGAELSAVFCGLDYDYVYGHGAYRQLLLRVGLRAAKDGVRCVRLGMGADLEKERLGATPEAGLAFVQVEDHFNGELLREVVAEVELARGKDAAK